MILKLLFELVLGLLEIVFSWVHFPSMPEVITNVIDMTFEYMEQGLSILFFFVDNQLILTLLPIVIVIENFDKLYSITMWIMRKIPFLGIK